jgi:hypothetical protein
MNDMKKMILFLFTATLFVASCNNDNDELAVSGTTRMNIRLTDSPGAFDALWLNVKEVRVRTSAGETTFPVNAEAVNILHFRMGKDTLIASGDISAGRIEEVRLVLNDEGNRLISGNTIYLLTTPSGQSSGIKLKVQDELTAGVAYTMLLDFDVARSIVKTGNGKYILKPVIRVVPNAVSGAIAGIVSPAEASPMVYAITGTDTLGTITDANGRFFFPGVSEGTYRIQIEPVSPFALRTIDDVEVVNGSVKDMGTISLN